MPQRASGVEMAESYLNDLKKELPCAVYLNGEYGFKNIYAGVPAVIGKEGVEKIIELDLKDEEKNNFKDSVKAVSDLYEVQKKLIANFKSFNKEKKIQFFLGVLLFLFAIVINQYYGNKGLFPHDSASHFDAGKRILLGEHPIKDYWIISGFIIDYIQSFFFPFVGNKLANLRITCFNS